MLSVNDRRTELFENYWPLPDGISYNCYLIEDKKCALLDTMHSAFGRGLLESIESIIGDRELDYLVLHHLEPDHSGEIDTIINRYPNVKIYGNSKTFQILEGYLGRVGGAVEIKDGDTLSLGNQTLKFVMTPWVHWPETMMSYEENSGMLFSGDAFGMFGAIDGYRIDDQLDVSTLESHMLRYYTNVVGKYSSMMSKALTKISDLEIKYIAPLHGIVWHKNIEWVVELYKKWSSQSDTRGVVIAFGSMYGFNEHIADYIAKSLVEQGVRDVKMFDTSKSHPSYILEEIWRSSIVLLGSCAYNGSMFTSVETLVNILGSSYLENKKFGIFGTGSWCGGGVRSLIESAKNNKWELLTDPVELIGKPNCSKLSQFNPIIDAVVSEMRE